MKSTRGFTLVELLIVLAMLGIFFALGAAALPRDKFAVSQAAKGLARDFQLARFEAISRNWFVGLHLDPVTNTYVIYCDNPRNAVTDCTRPDFSPDPSPSASNKKYDAGSDVVLKTVDLTSSYGPLVKLATPSTAYSPTVFDPRGTVYNGAAGKTIAVSNARQSYTIKVILSPQGRTRLE